MRRDPARYRLALRQRQGQPRAIPWRWPYPAVRRYLKINRRRLFAKRTADRLQRLTALPAIPQFRFLCRSETSTKYSNHSNTLHLSVSDKVLRRSVETTPRKRKSRNAGGTSEMCHKRTFGHSWCNTPISGGVRKNHYKGHLCSLTHKEDAPHGRSVFAKKVALVFWRVIK